MADTLIGKNEIRIDAYDKATGRAMFASDYFTRAKHMPRMHLFTTKCAHAKVVRLDVSKAEALPGVIRIITGKEPGVPWELYPKPAYMVQDRVLWAGQIAALVLAVNDDIAEEALGLIEFEVEQMPHVLNFTEAYKPDPVSVIDPDFGKRDAGASERPMDEVTDRKSPNVVGKFFMQGGDLEEGFKQSEIIVERDFFVGVKTASQLETATSVCEYFPSDGSITMISNGAGVHGVIKQNICALIGLPQNRVRQIQPYMGGSFGSRLNSYLEVLTALMAVKAKSSVACKYTREQMFKTAPSNWPCYTTIKMGVTKDGELIAHDHELGEEIGAAINNNFFSGRLSSSGVVPVYRFPNLRIDSYAVVTNTTPATEYRGLGCPECEFGIECLINELADKLGISPVELRLKNMIEPGERDAFGEIITSTSIKECLTAVADAIGIDKKPEQGPGPWKRGKGVAAAGKQNTPLGRAEAKVRYNCDGSAELLISCDETGMGATTTLTQICANELGLEMKDIKTIKGDTQTTPYDNYTASSRATYVVGNAIIAACDEIKAKLKEEIAREFGMHPTKVIIKGKKAELLGTWIQEVEISSLFRNWSPFEQNNWGLKIGSPIEGHGVFSPAPAFMWDENGKSKRIWNWFQYSAAAVEVEVNEETGQVRVIKIASAADTGNPVNPAIVKGQIVGGVHMAIGFSLNEEHLYDKNGEQSNANFSDYRLPTISEMPKNENVMPFIIPSPLPDGPYGAKGMAESITIPVGPAIQEAIYQAVGVRINGYPMTAERVLSAIKKRSPEGDGKK